MDKKEDIQRKIMEFQILEANLKALEDRANVVNQRLEELSKTKIAIEDLKKIKPDKALIPLGSGNFIFGSVENREDVIVGIGSGIAIKKNREQAIKILEERLKELEESMGEITTQSLTIANQLDKIQQDLEKLQK